MNVSLTIMICSTCHPTTNYSLVRLPHLQERAMGFTTFWDKLFNPQKNTHEESRENAHIPTAEATTGCDVYDENGHHIDRTFDYRSGFHWVEEHPGHFVWLQLRDPNRRQMTHVGRVYNLHELLVEDCSTDHQRPKLESFDDSLTLVARTLR